MSEIVSLKAAQMHGILGTKSGAMAQCQKFIGLRTKVDFGPSHLNSTWWRFLRRRNGDGRSRRKKDTSSSLRMTWPPGDGWTLCTAVASAATFELDDWDRRSGSGPSRSNGGSSACYGSSHDGAAMSGDSLSRAQRGGDERWKRVERQRKEEAMKKKKKPGVGPWQRDNAWRFWPKGVVLAGSLLTNRIVELGKRRQLDQVFSTLEEAKKNGQTLNTIIMNAAMAACVQSGDVDRAIELYEDMIGPNGTGVDTVTYGTLLKGLGEAGRLDDAFELLEAMEEGTAPGQPEVTDIHLRTLMNACAESGDILRARGVLDRHQPNTMSYNMLIKGYARSDNPLEALTLMKEMRGLGLPFQRLTYNSLILACIRGGDVSCAFQILKEMKRDAILARTARLLPDVVTYTTLLKGMAKRGNLRELKILVEEMKAAPRVTMDRIAYSAVVDAFIVAGSPQEASEVMVEMEERAKKDPQLRPRVHVFLAVMRAFAEQGDVERIRELQGRMVKDAGGHVWPEHMAEADELLAEAALVSGQAWIARKIFRAMTGPQLGIRLTPRAHKVLAKLQALSSSTRDEMFRPLVFKKDISLDMSVESVMTSVMELRPVHGQLRVADVAVRFWKSSVLPIIDDTGRCTGVVYAEDCFEMNDILSSIMRPIPCLHAGASVSDAVSVLLKHKSEIAVVVKSLINDSTEASGSSEFVANSVTADFFKDNVDQTRGYGERGGERGGAISNTDDTNDDAGSVRVYNVSPNAFENGIESRVAKPLPGQIYGSGISRDQIDLAQHLTGLNLDDDLGNLGGVGSRSNDRSKSSGVANLSEDESENRNRGIDRTDAQSDERPVGFVTRERLFDFGDRCRHLGRALVPTLSVVKTR